MNSTLMRVLCHIVILLAGATLFSFPSFSQHLNGAGHLISNEEDPFELNYTTTATERGFELKVDNMILTGVSGFKTPYGFITLSGEYENTPSVFRIYTTDGDEVFKKTFSKTINFGFSPGRNFCAFHDGEVIHVINLQNNEIKSYIGSNIFSVTDQGLLAYYDDKTSTIHNGIGVAPVDEQVYRILYFNDQPLFLTMKKILMLTEQSAQQVFTATTGRIFDAEVFSGVLYISLKKEIPGEFVFNSFRTDDLKNFFAEEETHYNLASHRQKLSTNQPVGKPDSGDNELIRDPLYYYQDTVYQPVGNSYNEMQEYSIGSAYLHPGVDLLGSYLQNVYSVKSGYVKAIITISAEYHWRIAISNENTSAYTQGYLYAHLDQATIPYAVGDFVNEGDVVGQLVDFPVFGFIHCHFARIACEGATWNGNWGTFDNPLSYMTNLFDSIPPQFEKTINNDAFAFRDDDGNYLSPDNLSGNLRVISKSYDRVNADWRVDVDKLRYSISPLSSPTLMLLDTFAYDYNFYNDNYFLGPYYTMALNTIYSRDPTCYSTADYVTRQYYHIVTNSDGNDTINNKDSQQLFNTLNFPDGSYIFRVSAYDPSGNMAMDSMIVEIKNGLVGVDDITSSIMISPNPFTSFITVSIPNNGTAEIAIRNTLSQIVYSRQQGDLNDSNLLTVDLSYLPKGLYFVDITFDGKLTVKKIVKA